jgi:hypothetical protein
MGYHGFVELGSEKVLSNGEYMHSADAREKPPFAHGLLSAVCSFELGKTTSATQRSRNDLAGCDVAR